MSVPRSPNHFKVLIILLLVWLGLFAVTLITEARTMARGVMPLITGICVLWMLFWTLQWLRGILSNNSQAQPTTVDKTENGKEKSSE